MEPKHSRADSEARRENCGSPALDGCTRWQNHSCHIREQGRQYNHTLRNAETGAVRMPSRLTPTNQVLGRTSPVSVYQDLRSVRFIQRVRSEELNFVEIDSRPHLCPNSHR